MNESDARTLQQRIDRIFNAAVPSGAPGCVVGVQRGGELLFRGAYGLASLELAVPLTPRSRFRIASVSKQFTVTAVLMLAAQGRLTPRRRGASARARARAAAAPGDAGAADAQHQRAAGLPGDAAPGRRGAGRAASTARRCCSCIARNTASELRNPAAGSCTATATSCCSGWWSSASPACTLGEFLQRQVFGAAGPGQHQAGSGRRQCRCRAWPRPICPTGKGGWRRAMHGFEQRRRRRRWCPASTTCWPWNIALTRQLPGRLPAGSAAAAGQPRRG